MSSLTGTGKVNASEEKEAPSSSRISFDVSALRASIARLKKSLPENIFQALGDVIDDPLSVFSFDFRTAVGADGTNELTIRLGFRSELELIGAAVLACKWNNIVAHVTPEMIAAGEEVILGEIGSSADGVFFSASSLVERVYRAMRLAHSEAP
jgi:hypothetical protein